MKNIEDYSLEYFTQAKTKKTAQALAQDQYLAEL
jgi:hypothetical protein